MEQQQVNEKAAAIDDLLLMGAPEIRQALKKMFIRTVDDDLTTETRSQVIAAYEVLDNHLEQCEQFLLYEPAMV
jgi:hypothetical protein